MKPLLPYIFIILFPYSILFLIYSIFSRNHFLMEHLFHNNFFVGLLYLCIFGLIALISAVCLCISNLAHGRDALELAQTNMIIKIVQIPAYLLIFVIGFICMITIFTIGISLVLMLLDCASILFSGLVGVSAVKRCRANGILSAGESVLHGILQFLFCADIVSAIIIYRKTKQTYI